jgi:hypothetical protein
MFRASDKHRGMAMEFVEMGKLLLKVSICFHETIINPFTVGRGVRQGCPLAPNFFIIMWEVLNFMTKEVVKLKNIKGMILLGGSMQ